MTLAFVCGIPGAALAGLLRNRLRGKAPLLIILLLMALSVGLCPVVLSGPENGRFAAPFAITWGIAIGFAGKSPSLSHHPTIPLRLSVSPLTWTFSPHPLSHSRLRSVIWQARMTRRCSRAWCRRARRRSCRASSCSPTQRSSGCPRCSSASATSGWARCAGPWRRSWASTSRPSRCWPPCTPTGP